MGLLNVTSHMALRENLPTRKIARRIGISRNIIIYYLKSAAVEPRFVTPKRQNRLDLYAKKLSGWLVTEQRKSRKDRRTGKQMHADHVPLG